MEGVMDMGVQHEDDQPDYELHTRLASAVVKMVCTSLIVLAGDRDEHRHDMIVMGNLIMLEILQHVFRPSEVHLAEAALDRHYQVVKALLLAAAKESSTEQ